MGLILKDLNMDGFERVVEVNDPICGLKAFIAIHNTTLGPALGGIRFYPYSSSEQALTDVKRLSAGMTHKSAISGVGFGGGKSVVMMHPSQKTPELLSSFCNAVNQLEGSYICAADYGCTPEDIRFIKTKTKYVVGGDYEGGSGDPGAFTAWGVIVSMKATLKKLFGSDCVEGKKIAIQGLGSVGFRIAEHLFWLGAELIVADPCVEKVLLAKERFGAKSVSLEEIYSVECSIFSPCALGGILNAETIKKLRCQAVVGCANNQLLFERDALVLKEKGILYAPDFVINAGGLINVSFELDVDGYSPIKSRKKIESIYQTLMQVYDIAEDKQVSTHEAVLSLISYRLEHKIGKREVEVCFPELVGV